MPQMKPISFRSPSGILNSGIEGTSERGTTAATRQTSKSRLTRKVSDASSGWKPPGQQSGTGEDRSSSPFPTYTKIAPCSLRYVLERHLMYPNGLNVTIARHVSARTRSQVYSSGSGYSVQDPDTPRNSIASFFRLSLISN